jgi:hypothetical protein
MMTQLPDGGQRDQVTERAYSGSARHTRVEIFIGVPSRVCAEMGYQEDFILRLAKRIGEVLARALGLAKQGHHDESVQALEQGVGAELGIPFGMLLRLDAASAARLLGKEKAMQLVAALRTRAVLFGIAGRDDDARASSQRADDLETALG